MDLRKIFLLCLFVSGIYAINVTSPRHADTPNDNAILQTFRDAKVFLYREYPDLLREPGNQHHRGICWAYSAVKLMNHHLHLEAREREGEAHQVNLQEIVERTHLTYRCDGNDYDDYRTHLPNHVPNAMKRMTFNGLHLRPDYKSSKDLRKLADLPCMSFPKKKAFLADPMVSSPGIDNAYFILDKMDRKMPMAASLKCLTKPFMDWLGDKGIYSESLEERNLVHQYKPWTEEQLEKYGEVMNHAVLIVGYGHDENGRLYYIIQNSWGKGWGIAGFGTIYADIVAHAYSAQGLLLRDDYDDSWFMEMKEKEVERVRLEKDRRMRELVNAGINIAMSLTLLFVIFYYFIRV